MTGPQHYAKAEKCIGWAETETDRDKRTSLHARAQVHATLALAAATALALADKMPEDDFQDWLAATSAGYAALRKDDPEVTP
jgi:hypothetical protein